LSEGDFVEWDSSGGTAYGMVAMVATGQEVSGSLEPEDTEHDTSEENPGVIIELVSRNEDGEVVGDGDTVFHRPDELRPISEEDVPDEKGMHEDEEEEGMKSAVGERRQMAFETKGLEIKQDEEDGEFQFEGYGAVFGNKDRGGDIIKPGAFKQTINRNDGTFPLVADHDLTMKSRVGLVYAEEDNFGVKVQAHVNTQKQLGREIASDIRQAQKHGEEIGMSFGYEVKQDDYDKEKDARLLKEVKTYEFSLTQIPMNQEAAVTGVKSFLNDEAALEKLARKIAPILAKETDLIARLKSQVSGDDSATDSAHSPSAAELAKEMRTLASDL
jgi:HK97 family phage prohead protease